MSVTSTAKSPLAARTKTVKIHQELRKQSDTKRSHLQLEPPSGPGKRESNKTNQSDLENGNRAKAEEVTWRNSAKCWTVLKGKISLLCNLICKTCQRSWSYIKKKRKLWVFKMYLFEVCSFRSGHLASI